MAHIQQIATLLCSPLGDTKDANECKSSIKLIIPKATIKMSLSIYLKSFVQSLKQNLYPRSLAKKQTNEAGLQLIGNVALILGQLVLSDHLALKFKTNFIVSLKTSISLVQSLDKSVTNFYSLIESLALKTVQALHAVD